ncbi:hypothetical protein BDP55DRAFT_568143 [Colletotrichum godetiae]|uniref:Uncharacterized protein n=1 Tax=Colletotrichum godetiae TaxID=1209918 RepID=A0AAJ0EL12_9PEZI|nr:uncharacterized protein BDP55DRAFT_568143 [Colletotrichum godetiae]KAK1657030.1 hypothetical protein BDP55DRAFT_568143 [Colletotrichum godetiae]
MAETTPTSLTGKAHERFVTVTALLHLIDPVRGEPTTYSLDRHPHDSYWKHEQHQKKFLDSFALISSTSRIGGETASAVCLEQGHPGGTVLRLARNLGVPKDLLKQLQDVLIDLTAVSLRDKRPDDVEPEVLRKVVILTQDRIRALVEKISLPEIRATIERAIQEMDQSSSDNAEELGFRTWVRNLPSLASLDARSHSTLLIPHVQWASRGRWMYSEHLERLFGLADGSLPLWLKYVYKLGRYFAATKAMLKLAVKQPSIFTGIHIEPIDAPEPEDFSLGTQREPLLTLLKKIAQSDPEVLREKLGQTWLTTDPETKLRRACKMTLIVHAEMQLLSFYDHHPHLTPRLLFMGTSKKACYLCNEFMSRHPLNVGVSASHQKIYPAWMSPPCHTSVRKQQRARLWELSRHLEQAAVRDLETRLGTRRPMTMDSTAGPSLTTTGTISSGFWSRDSNLGELETDEESASFITQSMKSTSVQEDGVEM